MVHEPGRFVGCAQCVGAFDGGCVMNSRVFGYAIATIGALVALIVGGLFVTAVGIVRGWIQ